MAEYAKIFDPKPLTQARSSLVEMSTSLSEAASKVIDNIPTDLRDQFREKIAQYKTFDELPDDLKDVLNGGEFQVVDGPSEITVKEEDMKYSQVFKGAPPGQS